MTSENEEQQREDTPMPAPGPQRPSLQQVTGAAYRAARRTAFDLARDLGAVASNRPIFHGSTISRPDVEPFAGIRASRHVEMASHRVAKEYIRAAREAGYTWDDIGRELQHELLSGFMTGHINENVADTAYSYAVGPDPEAARYYGQSFTWTCPSCSNVIHDHGMCNGPADDEEGHAEHCSRLAATIDAWNAQWEAIEADWEAGQ